MINSFVLPIKWPSSDLLVQIFNVSFLPLPSTPNARPSPLLGRTSPINWPWIFTALLGRSFKPCTRIWFSRPYSDHGPMSRWPALSRPSPLWALLSALSSSSLLYEWVMWSRFYSCLVWCIVGINVLSCSATLRFPSLVSVYFVALVKVQRPTSLYGYDHFVKSNLMFLLRFDCSLLV